MKRLSRIIIAIVLLNLVLYLESSGGPPFGKLKNSDLILHWEYGEEDIPNGLKIKITVKYEIKSGQKVLRSKRIEKYDESGRLVETQYHSEPSGEWFPKGVSRKCIYKYDDKAKQMEQFQYDLTDNSLNRKEIYKYDAKGYLIEQAEYDENGNLESKLITKFDNNGNLIEDAVYYQDTLVAKGEKKFDAKGNLIEIISYDPKIGGGLEKKVIIYKYDDKDNKIERAEYDAKGNLDKKYSCKNKYDAKENLVEVAYFDKDGNLTSKNTYQYDAKGNETEHCRYDEKGKLDSKETSKYDAKGNLIEYCDYDKKGGLSKKSTYKYDNKENLIEEAHHYGVKSKYSPDTQTVYEYEFYPEKDKKK